MKSPLIVLFDRSTVSRQNFCRFVKLKSKYFEPKWNPRQVHSFHQMKIELFNPFHPFCRSTRDLGEKIQIFLNRLSGEAERKGIYVVSRLKAFDGCKLTIRDCCWQFDERSHIRNLRGGRSLDCSGLNPR